MGSKVLSARYISQPQGGPISETGKNLNDDNKHFYS